MRCRDYVQIFGERLSLWLVDNLPDGKLSDLFAAVKKLRCEAIAEISALRGDVEYLIEDNKALIADNGKLLKEIEGFRVENKKIKLMEEYTADLFDNRDEIIGDLEEAEQLVKEYTNDLMDRDLQIKALKRDNAITLLCGRS